MIVTLVGSNLGRKEEILAPAIDGLNKALAMNFPGYERTWAEQVEEAVAKLLEALQQHVAAAEAPDGLFARMNPFGPTMTRHITEFRRQHGQVVDEAEAFRREIQKVKQAFHSEAGPAATGDLPQDRVVAAIPDFGQLRQQGEQLVADLHHHCEAEEVVLLDSLNTDFGAGD